MIRTANFLGNTRRNKKLASLFAVPVITSGLSPYASSASRATASGACTGTSPAFAGALF